VNFLIAGVAGTRGALPFDPSLPTTDAELCTTIGIFACARSLDLWGPSGEADVIDPHTDLSGPALYRGDPIRRDVTRLADPRFRLSVNLHGAPALTLPAFSKCLQDLVVDARTQVSAPLGS
jgi:hypothetical protein